MKIIHRFEMRLQLFLNRRFTNCEAVQLASAYSGGYSGEFLSAQEFHKALLNSIKYLKQDDSSQLHKLAVWFAPTSCWDDFIGFEGRDLANEISELLTKLNTVNQV